MRRALAPSSSPRVLAGGRHADANPERGDIVLGWLTKITVILGVAGLVLFDAISLGTTTVTLSDQGNFAAREASEVWQATDSLQQAYDAAVAAATEQNAQNVVDPKSFHIDEDNTVHLTVSRTATTILLYHWSRTAEWAEIERPGVGRSVA
jgi:hypothetical protein